VAVGIGVGVASGVTVGEAVGDGLATAASELAGDDVAMLATGVWVVPQPDATTIAANRPIFSERFDMWFPSR
jgi:hypothetical protein